MKKVSAFCLALFLFVISVFVINSFYNTRLGQFKGQLNYEFNIKKQDNLEALSNELNEDTILFLGSCELEMIDEKSHPKSLLNNGNSDFNIMLLGIGYDQSLSHAINVGALSNKIQNKKVVLNLSPSWFNKENITTENFSSKFYKNMFDSFIKNPDISKETKLKIINRCEKLLSAYPEELEDVQKYKKIYLDSSFNILDRIYIGASNLFSRIKAKNMFLKDLNLQESNTKKVIFEDIDFNSLEKESEQQGKDSTRNNDFFISDDYYTTHIKRKLSSLKDSQKDDSYTSSAEYDDLRLFLDVCRETGIEVMLINNPVNGYWYDYTGFPKEDREQYYKNIRDIAKEYNVEVLDLSEYEYTPYFLKDPNNLGWKGWIYVDKGVYEFYKKD